MRIQRVREWLPGAALAALLATGCSSPLESGATVSRAAGSAGRRIANVNLSEAQPVAERVFRQRFRIDSAASGPGLIVSQAQEVNTEAQPQQMRDVLGGKARHRRVAQLRLDQQGPDLLLRCIVQTQRLETSERAAFSGQRGDDRPTDTPIDRLGAASADNREEWGAGKRDRELEQEILRAVEEALRPASQPTS